MYVITFVVLFAFFLAMGISSCIQSRDYTYTHNGSDVIVKTAKGTVSTFHIPTK